jgi:hypothetical protein
MAVFWVALMMEAARSSETLVNFYQTTRRYNLEDSHLHFLSFEELRSFLFVWVQYIGVCRTSCWANNLQKE